MQRPRSSREVVVKNRSLWGLFEGSKWVAAGALIFNDEGKILLIKHRWRGAWEYPAGASMGAESPLEAARREVYEEVGLKPARFKLLAVDFFHRRTPNGNLVFTFSAMVKPREAARLRPDKFEIADYRWVTRGEAYQLIAHRLKRRLHELLKAHDHHETIYLQTGEPI